MEGSRRGKGNREKRLLTPDPYVDGGNGVKTIVYNTKKERLKRKRKKKNIKVEEMQQQKGRI